jgi:F0F1-type ATP synthase membrane subunit b/b'
MLLTNARAELAVAEAKTDWGAISREITARITEHSRNEVKQFEREMQRFANRIGSELILKGK